MLEFLNVIAALCAIRSGDLGPVAMQAKCHAYYAECINKKDKTQHVYDRMLVCMTERGKIFGYKKGK